MRSAIVLLLSLTILTSCDNLVNGVVRDIELPPHESQLAGSLFLDSRDSSLSALVSTSAGVYDTTKSRAVKDAQCRILQDGTPIYTWTTQDFQGNYVELLPDRLGALSGTITFEASHPDFETVSATQVFPAKPDAEISINYAGTQLYGDVSDELVLTLKDIPGVNQHYIISMDVHFRTALSGQDTSQYYDLYWETESPNTTQLWGKDNAVLVSENGVDRDIKIIAATGVNPISFGMLHEYRVKVTALSQELYEFYRSYNAFSNAQNNPFAEPVVLYSNMSNNMGCFGVSTSKMFYK
jgi:predicted small secreted protein